MLPDGGGKAAKIVTPHSLALCSGADNRPKPRIMCVRYVRKQVMLNLMIQASGKPRHETRVGSEVCTRTDLVHRPIVFGEHPVEFHFRREVRNLKDSRQYPAEDEME